MGCSSSSRPTTRYTAHQHLGNADYAWGSQVDAAGLVQVLDLWGSGEPPSLMWWNTTLTDAAHHAGGPESEIALDSLREADRRLGVWLDLVESRGLLETRPRSCSRPTTGWRWPIRPARATGTRR